MCSEQTCFLSCVQALELEDNIKSLLMTMIEESRPETFAESQVRQTLKSALVTPLWNCENVFGSSANLHLLQEICTTLDLNTIKSVANDNFQKAMTVRITENNEPKEHCKTGDARIFWCGLRE